MKRKIVMKSTVVAFILLFTGFNVGTARSQDFSAQAGKFITLLSGGEYEMAVGMFDKTMKSALPKEKLEGVWKSILSQCGAFKSQGDIRKARIQQYDVIYVPCQFEKTALDGKIVFNKEGMIAGLFFVPPGSK